MSYGGEVLRKKKKRKKRVDKLIVSLSFVFILSEFCLILKKQIAEAIHFVEKYFDSSVECIGEMRNPDA
jgi:hypothetical protein